VHVKQLVFLQFWFIAIFERRISEKVIGNVSNVEIGFRFLDLDHGKELQMQRCMG